MSELKYCQSPLCHTYQTKDRLKGSKGNKSYQTRRRSSFYYGNGNFCSLNCYDDWSKQNMDRAINHFGRITQPIVLEERNAWRKRYRWNWERDEGVATHYYHNIITGEERDITEEQYNNENYTLNQIRSLRNDYRY
jgi:hypothetical protein